MRKIIAQEAVCERWLAKGRRGKRIRRAATAAVVVVVAAAVGVVEEPLLRHVVRTIDEVLEVTFAYACFTARM